MAISLNAIIDKHEWVLDLGATYHMSHNSLDTFDQIMCPTQMAKIHLSNGQATSIAHIGNVKLVNKLKLKDVLHVPYFKFNLLYVSKVVKGNQCYVIFHPKFCLIQDCANKKLLGIGKEQQGLYYLVNPLLRCILI